VVAEASESATALAVKCIFAHRVRDARARDRASGAVCPFQSTEALSESEFRARVGRAESDAEALRGALNLVLLALDET
jgi:hypothetical protein